MPIQSPAKDLRKTSERPPQGLCSGRGAKWAQHSPAKDLRRGFVRTGARKGLRTAHRKTSKSPSKVGALLLILFRGIPEHLGKKNKGSTRYTDAPLVRKTDVRAVMVPSLLTSTRIPLCGSSATDERRTNCNTRSPRRFRLCRNRGPPCGNQSEPAESRR